MEETFPNRRRIVIAVTAVCISTIAACGGEAATGSASTTADSAGITIVTNGAPRLSGEAGWRLSDAPRTTAGTVAGAPDEQLFNVTDAALLSDGRVVVGNRGSGELKVFDASGALLRSFGGEGEGPGEFQWLHTLDVGANDSLFVWDQRLRRISVFSPEAGFIRSFPLESAIEDGFPDYAGRFQDGQLLVQTTPLVTEELEDLEVRTTRPVYFRYMADGATRADSIGQFRGSRSLLKFHDSGGGLSILDVPFDPVTRLATSGNDLFEGDGLGYEIRKYDRAGTLVHVIRRDHRPTDVTEELVMLRFDEQFGGFAERVPDYYANVRDAFEAMPAQGTIAAFDEIRATPDGQLWVRSYPQPGDLEHYWSVFSPDGAWLSDLRTPADLEVHDVTSDAIVAVRRDGLDVEQVVVYDVLRP